MLFLFVVLFFSISNAQTADTTIFVTDSTNIILLKFSEPININDALNINNYTIKDNTNKTLQVKKVGVVKNANPINSEVALIVNRLEYKKSYTITVVNVRDTANNYIAQDNKITFYFSGYSPSMKKTQINIK